LATNDERSNLCIATPNLVEVIDIDKLKSSKLELIKQERDRRVQEGGYKVGTKWYHSDTFSRTQQMGLVMLGANIPAGLQWKTMDGSFITMTTTLAQQIFGAGAMQDTLTFAKAEEHRIAVYALTDIQAVKEYDVTTGWPQIYSE